MLIFSQYQRQAQISFLTALRLLGFSFSSNSQILEPFKGNTTLTYDESIEAYEALARSSEIASLLTVGETDVGEPLHLFVINSDKQFSADSFDENKVVLLINYGIHPGEPCGIDASV